MGVWAAGDGGRASGTGVVDENEIEGSMNSLDVGALGPVGRKK